MKNILKLFIFVITSIILSTNTYASNIITEKECNLKDSEEYIFAGGECIQYYISEGEVEDEINIVVHGTWDAGTNTLGRYGPFADNLSMSTDITTIAIALPGYSDSSTNNFKALSHNGTKNLAAQKEYIEFLSNLVQKLKINFEAKKVNYIGHSAGALMGSTLTGYSPKLINVMVSAGAGYDIHSKVKDSKGLVSLVDYIDQVDKKTKFLIIYGTKDKISKPEVSKEYHQVLNNKGFDTTLIEVVDAPHLDLDMSDTSIEAIAEILEEE